MDYLILTDKFNPVPKEIASDIQFTEVRGKLFEIQAGNALVKLMEAAEKSEIKLEVISGYRSDDYQQLLWEKEISKLMSIGYNYHSAVCEVGKTLALPGASEHSTGLAVDFAVQGEDDVDDSFRNTAASKWLRRHAAQYGFILRYPRLKEHITGIDYEPWHYRYVGIESAKIITENGICLEEFLHFYQDLYTGSSENEVKY